MGEINKLVNLLLFYIESVYKIMLLIKYEDDSLGNVLTKYVKDVRTDSSLQIAQKQ